MFKNITIALLRSRRGFIHGGNGTSVRSVVDSVDHEPNEAIRAGTNGHAVAHTHLAAPNCRPTCLHTRCSLRRHFLEMRELVVLCGSHRLVATLPTRQQIPPPRIRRHFLICEDVPQWDVLKPDFTLRNQTFMLFHGSPSGGITVCKKILSSLLGIKASFYPLFPIATNILKVQKIWGRSSKQSPTTCSPRAAFSAQ